MLKKKVIAHFGSVVAVANALNISHSAICQWRDVIPEKNALRLYQITNGALRYDESFYRHATQSTNHP